MESRTMETVDTPVDIATFGSAAGTNRREGKYLTFSLAEGGPNPWQC